MNGTGARFIPVLFMYTNRTRECNFSILGRSVAFALLLIRSLPYTHTHTKREQNIRVLRHSMNPTRETMIQILYIYSILMSACGVWDGYD